MPLIKDKYLTIQVVADILSCTERHIYDLIVEGALVAIKVGSRAVRVSEQSLNDFIEKRKINPEDLFDPDKDKEKKQASVAPAGQPVARPRWMNR
jgi:excisionase family DNA binding protein